MSHQIASWNIKDAQNPMKLDNVKTLIHAHSIKIVATLETKLSLPLSLKAATYINPTYKLNHNFDEAPYGRILIVHDPYIYTLNPILSTSQIIHLQAFSLPDNLSFHLTFIYANNVVASRQNLLNTLPSLRQDSYHLLVLGDFNYCINLQDKLGGLPVMLRDIAPLNISISYYSLMPIARSGVAYS